MATSNVKVLQAQSYHGSYSRMYAAAKRIDPHLKGTAVSLCYRVGIFNEDDLKFAASQCVTFPALMDWVTGKIEAYEASIINRNKKG